MRRTNVFVGSTQIDEEALQSFCVRHHVRALSLFGSTLRGEEGPDSDIDLLVDFAPGTRIGLFGIAKLEAELSDMFGRPVDLRSPADLSKHFRDRVVAEARPLYAA
jgi:uncharacterized protein